MRDLIVLTAFAVVLGTLVIQGLTLKPLLRALKLRDGDPVAAELKSARQRLVEAALARLPAGSSPASDLVRKDFKVRMGGPALPNAIAAFGADYAQAYRTAIEAAREDLLAIRASGTIGDDAFHELENELDWMEVSDPLRGANAD